jgi:hypothetical protein
MAKLKISIALAVAVGQMAATSGAQSLPTRRDAPKPPPTTAAPAAPSDAPSSAPVVPTGVTNNPAPAGASANPAAPPAAASSGTSAVAPATAAAPAPVPSAAPPTAPAPEPATTQPGTVANQPEPLDRNLLPVVVNQAQPPEVTESPRTYEHHFTVTLDVANVLWRTSTGYDLFSSNDAAWRIAIGAGYDVFKLPNQVILAAEVGAMVEPGQSRNSSSGLLGNTVSGTLTAATLMLGGSLRWALTPWFAPYGRLGLFTSRYAVDIHAAPTNVTASNSGVDWSYHRWAEGGSLGAGALFNLPPRSPVNVGVLVEGGYWLQQSVDIVLEGNPPAGSISTLGARLGSLGNSGPYLRFAGVLRF